MGKMLLEATQLVDVPSDQRDVDEGSYELKT